MVSGAIFRECHKISLNLWNFTKLSVSDRVATWFHFLRVLRFPVVFMVRHIATALVTHRPAGDRPRVRRRRRAAGPPPRRAPAPPRLPRVRGRVRAETYPASAGALAQPPPSSNVKIIHFRPMLKTSINPMVFIGILGEIPPEINFSLKIFIFTKKQLFHSKSTFDAKVHFSHFFNS